MPVSRVFLDWNHPILPQTAGYLRSRFATDQEWDLQKVILVVPTARAGHRLLEILVADAEKESLRLIPPTILTLRDLPEKLYTPKRPFAEPLTQQFAWVKALRTLPNHQRSRLMRRLPDALLLGWLAFASMLSDLHRELVANKLSIADVLEQIAQQEEPHELARWELLKTVEDAYLKILDDLGLWDRQTARFVAIQQEEFTTNAPIILAGILDLNEAHRAILSQVADQVTTLIAAPKSRTDWFDEFGDLLTPRWQKAVIDGIFEKTHVVDGPDDQALAVCLAMQEWNRAYPADDITVGVPDRRIAPAIEQRLGECGVAVHNGLGQPLRNMGPARMLSAAADLLESFWFRDFANLARHPQVELWLEHQGVPAQWLLDLDRYCSTHFPAQLGDANPANRSKAWPTRRYPQALGDAIHAVDQLLKPLRRRAQSITKWVKPMREILLAIYNIRPLVRSDEQDRKTLTTCEIIQDVLATIEDLPASLAPDVEGAEALRLVLREVEGQLVINPPSDNQVSLAGWLELPWDDAPALILTGMNEGVVPNSQSADAFLPNSLRRQMNLDDNDRRLARDAYALSLIAASRRELRLILGRRTVENDPLTPSRLLFACENQELPVRVQTLFAAPKSLTHRVRIVEGLIPGGNRAMFPIPKPEPLPEPVTSMRVTEFSAFLDCPYRYYLAYQLRLQSPQPSAEELPPNAFGDVIHDVLEEFGQNPDMNRKTDPNLLFDYLSDTLNKQTLNKFGRQPLPAVRIQIELARLRLQGFAHWQAGWAKQGWEIQFAEVAVEGESAHLIVDEEPMYLRGRLDRIDVREHKGRLEISILDYKTSDSGDPPEKKHRDSQGNWTDLQLPLYRHLVRAVKGLPDSDELHLGYIVLPKRTADIGERLADWTEDDLMEADEVAEEVVRCVRREAFSEPNPNPKYQGDFSAICQADLFGTSMQQSEEDSSSE